MPKLPYTDSDLHVKDGLERLFWIEIAKRKAFVKEAELFNALVEIRANINTFALNETESLRVEPFEAIAPLVFDWVQFGRDARDSISCDAHVGLLEQAMDIYGNRVDEIADQLSYAKGFRLADFSVKVDLEAIYHWWNFIVSAKGRRSLGANGQFSTMGELRPVAASQEIKFIGEDEPCIRVGDMIPTISSLSWPFEPPCPVTKPRVEVCSTDDCEITIAGELMKDKIVLCLDISKPFPSMREIEFNLRSEYMKAQSQRNAIEFEKVWESGVIPDGYLGLLGKKDDQISSENIFRLSLTPPNEHKLMTDSNRVIPFLVGLACWDLKADGLSVAQAIRDVAEMFSSEMHEKDFIITKARYALKTVGSHIDSYEPNMLPWAS